MDVAIHIEELVLHGFAPAEQHRIRAAVEAELSRLFTEQGVPAGLTQGGEAAYLDGGAFSVTAATRSEEVGAHVARAVYGGLKSERKRTGTGRTIKADDTPTGADNAESAPDDGSG